MSRPYFSKSIEELETAFDQRRGDPEFLKVLIAELSIRTTQRARKLAERAAQAAETTASSGDDTRNPHDSSVASSTKQKAKKPNQERRTKDSHSASGSPQADVETASTIHASSGPANGERPMPPLTDSPVAVLSAWTALEVLSPPSFRRAEDLAGGDRRAVAQLENGTLPWDGKGERARPNTRLYYQIVLGTIKLEEAVAKLLTCFADTRAERPAARGESILAVVVVDRDGRPVEQPAVAISSFGWGVPKALQGNLEQLADWQEAERALIEQLDRRIRRNGNDDELLPLDAATISKAYDWLVTTLGVPAHLLERPRFAIRSYEYFRSAQPPEMLLLNSFYLGDLALARHQFNTGTAPANLRSYLGVDSPQIRKDLLRDTAAVENALRPEHFPLARWPSRGRHPLVLLQQTAVNLAWNELRQSGILAVNGPPGTGKTTLLRDIVAALVSARADAMSTFDDPETAFEHSGQKLRAGNGWLHLYRLHAKLRGYEMLVASSNNRAVENVSAELPAIEAIAEDAGELRYFTTLSDALLGRKSWGLIAAVLGNARNRSRFKQVFWWGSTNFGGPNDVGLSTYLAAASGTPQLIEITDPTTGMIIETRPPKIVTAERAPRDHNEALKRWQKVLKEFRSARDKSETILQELQTARDLSRNLPQIAATEIEAQDKLLFAKRAEEKALLAARQSSENLAAAQNLCKAADEAYRHNANKKPGIFARLFNRTLYRTWVRSESQLRGKARLAAEVASRAQELTIDCKRTADKAVSSVRSADSALRSASEHLYNAVSKVGAARDRLSSQFVDESFFERDHAERHQLSPWLDKIAQRVRDDLFVASVNLHKAFIDAAAKPLRHNIGALMNAFTGRGLPDAGKEALLPDLWTSLFIVVPVVSTTFASVERMLGRLPPEALGWLLIDEAGQSLPQAAVGSLMRTKRAVVVGDPIQIEPVVTLSETLTGSICRRFGADPDRFNAPAASAQTLSDAATPYFAEFAGRQGSRTVGVPLLVHRRCAEPMFGISNAVAYERLMVNAKVPATSPIRDVLGPSRWIDIQGTAVEKWCPQEGETVIELLRAIAGAGIAPDLYIVTPFVVVQDNLRSIIRSSGVLEGWTDDPWAWTSERVGTVHTVQGREAEAVIFVLGAPSPHQSGARGWAGGRPNLLNVAVSRAKEALYVVGNRKLWRNAGMFHELDARLPT
jgi:hypothetical protein